FLNPEIGLINTQDPIPLHISAYGPRSQALTAKLGAGWKSFISDVPGAMNVLEGMQQSWQSAKRVQSDLYATAWTCGCVLAAAELIRRTTFTAREQELKQRVEALRGAGWSQLVIAIAPGQEPAIEDWARIKRAFD